MGSLIVESFFAIPGLGSYTIDAISRQDFAIVRSMVFLRLRVIHHWFNTDGYFLYLSRPQSQVELNMPVIFITDAFIFLLVFMVVAYVLYARQHEHLRAPWHNVASSSTGDVCGNYSCCLCCCWFTRLSAFSSETGS